MKGTNTLLAGPKGRCLSWALCLAMAWPLPAGSIEKARPETTEDLRIVHALNRLTFGPRPGDIERLRKLGLESWIDVQLHPERIPDTATERRLESLGTQRLDTTDLMKKYEIPLEARRELQRQRAERMESPGADSERELRRARLEVAKKYPDLEGTPRQVLMETQAAKLLRATQSESQLYEVMVDFWFNHFNVFADKGPEKLLIPEYEREVIRRHALGRFEDLLLATAKSPAMLFYLDNWLSADPNAKDRFEVMRGQQRRRDAGIDTRGRGARSPAQPPAPQDDPARPPAGPRRSGLNENYAREIMELHTLGVDGGYTQKDVTEVARCFTGWTIEGLRQRRPRFTFAPMLHDTGDKLVLGHAIKGSGRDEGEKVIHMLAAHPKTARSVSFKLARRFVADDPPPALVERAARTFEKTDGDIRQVLRTIFESPEFWEARQAKVKTPFEFVVSAVRAAGADVADARDLARRTGEMGMPLYLQQPPTGYKDTADAWVSTNGLLARLNFALDLAAGRVRGVTADVRALAGDARDGTQLASALVAQFLPAGVSEQTRRTLGEKAGASLDAARVAGLVLGSPEFQRR